MKRLHFKPTFWTMAFVLLSLLNYACQDDSIEGNGRSIITPGLPTTVHLTINVGDMDVVTRSIANDSAANYCDNLWIGFYNADSQSEDYGKLINQQSVTKVASTAEIQGTVYKLELPAMSATKAYIVAVANSDVNSGISDIDQYGTETESTLSDLLQAADTYDKFKKITLLRPDANDVNVYANTLTMSGYYLPKGAAANSEIQPVAITEGDCDLDGCINLTRAIAYNKFIIVPGQYVNLKLNTWKVCNVPHGCYLFEQDTNVGDRFTDQAGSGFYNSTLASHLFTATTNAKGVEGHSFEFYQLENKHTAVDYDADKKVGINPDASDFYTEREREFKSGNLNTGIYRSLVASADQKDMSNNHASYVVVNATIDYYVAAPTSDDETFDATTAEPIDPSSDVKKIHRTAIVDYTIHLGYCEDKENDKPTQNTAMDFNCRRNTKYTYNVTINGVKNVVVEAKDENGEEPEPGAEGWVSDEYGDYEELDSHYCEFNISLTDEERANMSYRITVPYGNNTYIYYKQKDGTVEKTDGMNEELYSWIKFYPTTAKDVLAEYNGGKDLWSFDDLCGENRKTEGAAADADGNQWYTVFVDEYVYHFDDDVIGTDASDSSIKYYDEKSWPNYANKDDRVAEFLMHIDESTDKESSYSYCKYAFGQKSIQTYYKGSKVGDKAIGVEHTEETYCLNMNFWYQSNTWDGERTHKITDETGTERQYYDYDNGRFDQWQYLNYSNRLQWSDVIQATVPGHVKAGASHGCSHPDADYPVYMPATNNSNKPGHSPSPNDGNVYYANSICMNRNRDLNGNGVIDANEVRWYLPTSSNYIQIAICQGELPDPLLNFTDYDPNYFIPIWANAGTNDDQGRARWGTYNFHYITADYQYYFAEQLAATGDNAFDGWGPEISAAYTARCIRNLGTRPSDEPQFGVNEVENAFSYDENTHIFDQYNFRDEQLRGYTIGGLAPHSAASVTAHPYKKFQVASKYCVAKDNYISFGNTLSYVNSATDDHAKTVAWTNSLKQNGICGQYYENSDQSDKGTWRIPSVGELGLMWIAGLPQKDNGTSYLCASYDYFASYKLRDYTDDNHLYLGYYDNTNGSNDRHIISLDVLGMTIRMRCVRDVK